MRRRRSHTCRARSRPQLSWSDVRRRERHHPARQRRPAGSAPAADPCAEATATTEPVATEAPATTAAAATEAPADGGAGHRAGPRPPRPRPPRPARRCRRSSPQLDPTTAIDINEQPRDALQQGGELRLGRLFADNWNPYNPLGNEVDYTQIREPMSYHVWNFAADGTSTLDTELRARVEHVGGTPGEPFTVTYKLNPDANWNNGDPIDVDDYIANWQALNGIDHPDFPVVATEGFDQITSVEQGADKFEVVITFDDVYPDYQALFDRWLPAESLQPDTYVDGWTELNTDWFTGPFILDSIDTTQGILTEVPNPNWWGEAPLLDKIIFRVVSPDAVPTATPTASSTRSTSAPTPTASRSPTPRRAARSGRRPARTGATSRSTRTAGLIADQEIRQAIVRSLDRADIGASDLAGIPWPAQPLNNHIFVENQAGYVDNAGDFAYDPERAMADLDAAGWVAGADGIREKDGQRLTVQLQPARRRPGVGERGPARAVPARRGRHRGEHRRRAGRRTSPACSTRATSS